MEVLYHIRPYFGGIFPYIGLKNRPYIWNRYLLFQWVSVAWPLTDCLVHRDPIVINSDCEFYF